MRISARMVIIFLIPFLLLCPISSANSEISKILSAHQFFRSEVGSPALVYSDSLAIGAKDWANYLASNSLFQHSGSNYGENLFLGSSGYYSWNDAVNAWGSEKKYFINGPFGDRSSSTGHWYDVGHYTQVIWYNTKECGCAKATGYFPLYSSNMDVFVCRYNPPGNYWGQYPFPVTIPTTIPTTIPNLIQPLPGSIVTNGSPMLPVDLNGDGRYEDVNGDGLYNYYDVIDFFTYLWWITNDNGPITDSTNEYQPYFDFDNSGVVNFIDVITLYNHIPLLN